MLEVWIMYIPDIYQYIAPILEKPLLVHNLECPLYYFASNKFNDGLLKLGYESIHPEHLYFQREKGDFIYFTKTEGEPYSLHFLTTLDYSQLEEMFAESIRNEYKNKFLMIRDRSLKMQLDLKAPEFDRIKTSISSSVVSKLENAFYNFENFCEKYSKTHLSNTLGLLLYAPPGYGKSLILRSLLKKLLEKNSFTVVQVHQGSIAHINLSQLLDSCKILFPCVLFIEDMDLLFYDRHQGRGAAVDLLETLEGLYQAENVAIIATSNNVNDIDRALLRPGRFDYLIEIEAPTYEAKKVAICEYMQEIDFEIPETILEKLIEISSTFAELKVSFQHVVRTYMGSRDFPDFKEVEKMAVVWKESRLNGSIRSEGRKVGLI
jgi:DNA replication protein DnaC